MNNLVLTVVVTVVTMLACLLIFTRGRVFYLDLKGKVLCTKWAQAYAGYDSKEVTRGRLWKDPSYYPRLLVGTQKTYPEEILTKLEFYMPLIAKYLIPMDLQFLENRQLIFSEFIRAYNYYRYDELQLDQQRIALARMEMLKYVVGSAANYMRDLPTTREDLLNWVDGLHRWNTVVSNLTLLFIQKSPQRS